MASPVSTLLPLGSPSPSGSSASLPTIKEDPERELFESPAELLCPITQSVFIDPVLTAAGHAYERSAIETHLARSATDPLTRAPLHSAGLTPVFVLRSRAAEYRTTAARVCVDRAACCGCAAEAVRYLRRAAELAGERHDIEVPGLSREAAAYVLAHPSNAYDDQALLEFARGLRALGYADRAAGVLFALLQTGSADRTRQAELLAACIDCWAPSSGGGTGVAATPPHQQGAGGLAPEATPPRQQCRQLACGTAAAAPGSGAPAPHNVRTVHDKLADLFARGGAGRRGAWALGWPEVVELSGEAGLGADFQLGLCEQLLLRAGPAGGPGGPAPEPDSWGWQKQVLMKYVHTLSQDLLQRTAALEARLEEDEGRRRGRAHGQGKPPGGWPLALRLRRPGWSAHPAAAAAAAALAALLGGGGPAARLARAAPALALLPLAD